MRKKSTKSENIHDIDVWATLTASLSPDLDQIIAQFQQVAQFISCCSAYRIAHRIGSQYWLNSEQKWLNLSSGHALVLRKTGFLGRVNISFWWFSCLRRQACNFDYAKVLVFVRHIQ